MWRALITSHDIAAVFKQRCSIELVFDTREVISEGMLMAVCYPHSSDLKTSNNSHCVDFVLLNVWLTRAYIAQSWCINFNQPVYFSDKGAQLQSGVWVYDLSESSAYVLVIFKGNLAWKDLNLFPHLKPQNFVVYQFVWFAKLLLLLCVFRDLVEPLD